MSRKTSRTEVRAIPMRRTVCRRRGGSKLRRRRTRIGGENKSLLPRAQAPRWRNWLLEELCARIRAKAGLRVTVPALQSAE